MGEAVRRQEYLEKAARLLHEQEKDAQPVPAKCSRCGKEELRVVGQACGCGGTFLQLPPPLAPEIQQLLAMPEGDRMLILQLDLLRSHALATANMFGNLGAPNSAGVFVQIEQQLTRIRSEVFRQKGSGLVIAGAGDLPPAPPG